jgi:hypothetical protein
MRPAQPLGGGSVRHHRRQRQPLVRLTTSASQPAFPLSQAFSSWVHGCCSNRTLRAGSTLPPLLPCSQLRWRPHTRRSVAGWPRCSAACRPHTGGPRSTCSQDQAPPAWQSARDCPIYILDVSRDVAPAVGIPQCDINDPQAKMRLLPRPSPAFCLTRF